MAKAVLVIDMVRGFSREGKLLLIALALAAISPGLIAKRGRILGIISLPMLKRVT